MLLAIRCPPAGRRVRFAPVATDILRPMARLPGMFNLVMRAWLACVECGRLTIQALGGGNGDPDALNAFDRANKHADSVDEAGRAESDQRPGR